MLKKKRLLFIVNGLGMGNATRCDSIIENMNFSKYDIDIVSSGNGIEYFKNVKYVNNLYYLKSLNYGKNKDGKLSALNTFLSLPKQILAFVLNAYKVFKILNSKIYSGVVIDSDYTMLLVRPFINIPVFALNNAVVVVQECINLKVLPRSIKSQLIIEKLDKCFHRLIPHHTLVPDIRAITDKKIKNYYIPFIRSGLNVCHDNDNAKLKTILVMLSGSTFGTNTSFLNTLDLPKGHIIEVIGRTGIDTETVKYHGKVYDNRKYIIRSHIMVINAGFSAVSEAIILGIPSVVIPVENHAEQYINAKIAAELGLSYVANTENVNEKIIELLNNFTSVKKQFGKYNINSNGANMAAQFIMEKSN